MPNTPPAMRRPASSDTVPLPREEIMRILATDAEHADELRCPACAPMGWSGHCLCCRESRFVSRATFSAWHQRGEGRVSETRLDSYEPEKV
jgi:hypothetical protein